MNNEPVAWHYPGGKADQCTTDKAYAEKDPAWTPMYYKHEWVELTDEQISQLALDAGIITWVKRVYDDVDKKFYDSPLGEGMLGDEISLRQFASLISNKLKEKNS